MFRIKCAALHLLLSLIFAGIIYWLVFHIWYPQPLSIAVGVGSIFLMVLVVDLVIGPLLTLVVSKPGKASLTFDWSVIAVLQISALIYGVFILVEARPAWIVFNQDRFDVVQAHEIFPEFIKKAPAEYQHIGIWGPKWVAAKLPEDGEARADLLFDSLSGVVDLPQRPDLYVPLSTMSQSVRTRSQPLTELYQYNKKNEVDTELAKWPEADAFLPLMARIKPMTVLLKKDTGAVIAVVPLDPWN